MMGYTYFSDCQQTLFDDWFATASDDDRVACVYGWYWDLGGAIETLQDIVDRPDCDVTTALTVFWSSEPAYYFETFADGREALGSFDFEIYGLLASILQRYKAGGYSHSGMQYDPREFGANGSQIQALAHCGESAIPPEMSSPVAGRPPVYTTRFEMYGVPWFMERLHDDEELSPEVLEHRLRLGLDERGAVANKPSC